MKLFAYLILSLLSFSQIFSIETISKIEAIWKTRFSGRQSAIFSYIATSENNIWFIDYEWSRSWPLSKNQDGIREKWQIGDLVKLNQEAKDWKMTNISQNSQPITVWGPYASLKESFEIGKQRDSLFIPFQGEIRSNLDAYKGKINIVKVSPGGNSATYLQLKDLSYWKFKNHKDVSNLKDGDIVTITFEWGHLGGGGGSWEKYHLKKDAKTFEILPK